MARRATDTRRREALGLHTRVAEAREAAGYSTEQVAAWLGVHVSVIHKIERGIVGCSAERVAEIARVLGVSVASLYGETRKAG